MQKYEYRRYADSDDAIFASQYDDLDLAAGELAEYLDAHEAEYPDERQFRMRRRGGEWQEVIVYAESTRVYSARVLPANQEKKDG